MATCLCPERLRSVWVVKMVGGRGERNYLFDTPCRLLGRSKLTESNNRRVYYARRLVCQ